MSERKSNTDDCLIAAPYSKLTFLKAAGVVFVSCLLPRWETLGQEELEENTSLE
ncbi:hypothetical protein [Corynebacterium kozikiae]|uniref:hypothetical protein n=1 Tax=Corynebacterium kozikiae TaxID=2968469 RepID=UPI00211C99C6|nr:hypothetical protein [Corynebacterium sp. 76QC2CO]MCQ9342418.1 hypothetical protein [Corynebacterium sp. 76QC2CO]